ncbi:14215_t:CDS:2 [Funneliformis mosseae]|uniref:14215_t:CDS:1 n=1 Tax=Funneliformis mosseae TaxID=27381 RepID=A0A9N8YP93_FUNMO|nr:14215_t:CDS:2 [Funneliformis mosseae]
MGLHYILTASLTKGNYKSLLAHDLLKVAVLDKLLTNNSPTYFLISSIINSLICNYYKCYDTEL